jgi:hypothetical protein
MAFGRVMGSVALCLLIGPVAGTQMAPRVCFIIAPSLSVLVWLYINLALPESLPVASRLPFVKSKMNPFVALKILLRAKFFTRLAASMFLSAITMFGTFSRFPTCPPLACIRT